MSDTQRFNDVWVLTNANGLGGSAAWTQLTVNPDPANGLPLPRLAHSSAYDVANDRMIIWGGDSFGQSAPDLNDVWVLRNASGLDRTTGLAVNPTWQQIVSAPVFLYDRGLQYSTAVFDPVTNRMITFGGFACPGFACRVTGDVSVLTNANGLGGVAQWIQLSTTGGPPAARAQHSAVYDPSTDRMIIFAGLTSGPNFFGDVWVLSDASGLDRTTGNAVTPHWMQLTTTGGPPAARAVHAAAYNTTTNEMTIFGGATPSGTGFNVFLNDVWVLSNANGAGAGPSTWMPVTTTGTPPVERGVFQHFTLYDPATDRLIIVWGFSQDPSFQYTFYTDAWVLGIPTIPVPVDIKPTSCPNPLNTKTHGVLPVAILGTSTIDVTQIDPATVRLAGVAPLGSALADVATPFSPFLGKTNCRTDCNTLGPDGVLDLTLKFDIQTVVAALGQVTDGQCLVVTLTGNLLPQFGSTPIKGEDVLIIRTK